jgi:hypothetical protein
MASPAVTEPPGELMYSEMGLVGALASRNSSCATMLAEVDSSMAPVSEMMRSLRSREKMSSGGEGKWG